MDPILIQYRFNLPDRSQESFTFQLVPGDIDLVRRSVEDLPPWTRLDFHRCPRCPLEAATHPTCPLAASLVDIVARFDRFVSYEQLELEVRIGSKKISQTASVQKAISSMMGLVIAICGCPVTAFFKPMAFFHLPLANEEETVYRAASTYLLAQYFQARHGSSFDLNLEGLTKIYRDIHEVNVAVARRLRAASKKDSSVNAIILLDLFAKALPYAIQESLEEISHLFAPYVLSGSKGAHKKSNSSPMSTEGQHDR